MSGGLFGAYYEENSLFKICAGLFYLWYLRLCHYYHLRAQYDHGASDKRKGRVPVLRSNLIANTYASGLYSNDTNLETVKGQLDALAVYLNSTIRIINPSGRLVLDTNAPLNVDDVVIIEGFDPTVTRGSYYTIGASSVLLTPMCSA